MEDCIFCKIVNGEIPSKKIYEDDSVYAFYDIAPVAPVHFLVIPKEHILNSAAEVTAQNADIIAHIYTVIAMLAKKLDIAEGFRVVTNCGDLAGQTVKHLHFHVIAGGVLGKMA